MSPGAGAGPPDTAGVPGTGPAPLGSVRAVLLDAFGTLLALEPPAPLLRGLLAERLGVQVSESQAGSALRAEIGFYRAHMAQGRNAERVADLHVRCAEVLRGALPISPALEAASPETIVALLLDSLRFCAYPEVADTLARLRGAGLRLVVVSNWDATLEPVLERVGIRSALDGVISSAVVGAAKPDPLPFRMGLELAGVGAGEVIHVGDSPQEDVAGALAAGVRPVLLERDGGDASGSRAGAGPDEDGFPAVPRIRTLDELPGMLGI